MNTFEIVSLCLGILSVILTILSYYLDIRFKIKNGCESAIVDAEELKKEGKEKFNEAVEQVYKLLPKVAQIPFTRQIIEKIMQSTFDNIKAFAEKQNKKEA